MTRQGASGGVHAPGAGGDSEWRNEAEDGAFRRGACAVMPGPVRTSHYGARTCMGRGAGREGRIPGRPSGRGCRIKRQGRPTGPTCACAWRAAAAVLCYVPFRVVQ